MKGRNRSRQASNASFNTSHQADAEMGLELRKVALTEMLLTFPFLPRYTAIHTCTTGRVLLNGTITFRFSWTSHSRFLLVRLSMRDSNQVSKLNSDFINLLKLEMDDNKLNKTKQKLIFIDNWVIILVDYCCVLTSSIYNKIEIKHFLQKDTLKI